jgi:hypothetical protein
MKSLVILKKESVAIQTEIKTLLLDNYRYDHSLTNKLDIISNVATLRDELAIVQREIRERLSA